MLLSMLTTPFARLSPRSATISGRTPYFAGPKNALCTANKTIAPMVSQRLWLKNPMSATMAIGISAILTQYMTLCLLNLSEICPA